MVEGMLLVNKPRGMTSHDVVQIVRRKLGIRRIGHTGTLDPLAEGLLILLVGAATHYQQAFQGHDKMYEATIAFGTQTDTGDAMGRVVRSAPVPAIQQDRVVEVLESFRGSFAQTPPTFSAVKVQGRPAYWWARRHQPQPLSPRRVQISDIALLACGPCTLTVRLRCSAGTYVRTLAESIAERLGTVGHVTSLTRLRIGQWHLGDAKPLTWITEASPAEVARELRAVAAIDAQRASFSPSNAAG